MIALFQLNIIQYEAMSGSDRPLHPELRLIGRQAIIVFRVVPGTVAHNIYKCCTEICRRLAADAVRNSMPGLEQDSASIWLVCRHSFLFFYGCRLLP